MLAPESSQTESQVKERINLRITSFTFIYYVHVGTVTGRIIDINVAIINYYSAIIAF